MPGGAPSAETVERGAPLSTLPRESCLLAHGEIQIPLRLPELRRVTQRWQGKCEACGEWNTIVEEAVARRHRRGGPQRAPAGALSRLRT